MQEIMWNEDPEEIRIALDSVVWLSFKHGAMRFPSNASPSGHICLGTIAEYRGRMEQAIATDEILRQWVKDHDTLLVVAKIDNDRVVSYDFYANAKLGKTLIYPLSDTSQS